MPLKQESKDKRKVPFTVIGGFLGAGKTSLINQLLKTTEKRYAILVNDFGALNIDEKLIQQHQGDTIALSNGCICCSLAAGFSKGLGTILDKLDDFDHIIIEASGIANPQKIQDIAQIEPALIPCGNLVMIDARMLLEQTQDQYITSIIHQQIHAADMLLINKQSLVTESEKRILQSYLSQFSDSPCAFTDWGKVEAEDILSLVVQQRKPNPLLTLVNKHGLYTQVLRMKVSITVDFFDHWVSSLPVDIMRGKGLLHFSDKPGTWSWQKVTDQVTLTRCSQDFAANGCELILIGTQPKTLTASLEYMKKLDNRFTG